ncbi:MAG: FadR/GntR family transcriptional regulator [Burkholderiales bacterium]
MAAIAIPHETVARIAGWIVGGRFAPGDTLPIEPALGRELAVSRTVVREALKALSAKGLVVTGPRVGTRVLPMTEWNLFDPDVLDWRLDAGVDAAFVRDLMELRLAIEPTAARLAAQAAMPEDIAAIRDAYSRMVESVAGRGRYLAVDLSFHQAVMQATHNQFFVGLVPAFSALLRVSFRLSVTSIDSARGSLPAHKRLLDAIAKRDVRAAERANAKIIEMARDDIERDLARDERFLRGVA